MQLVIAMNELKEAVAGLSRVVTGRSTLPVLSAVKISSEAGVVRITGTNFSEYLTRNFNVATGEGNFLIDFKEFKEFLKDCKKDGNVTFQIEMDRVLTKYRYNDDPVEHVFMRIPDNTWPTEPVFTGKGDKITADALESIMLALPMVSTDESKRTLNGALLEPGAIVASDGKQLVKFNCTTGVNQRVILPKTKILSCGMLAEQDGAITLSKAYCRITSGSWEYVVKAIAGSYPQYQHVIPQASECSITLSSHDIHYLKSALPLLESSSEHKTVHLYAAKDDVRFLSESLHPLHVKIEGNFTGPDEAVPAVTKMNKEQLLAALNLGFNKLSFNPNGVNPIMATGRRDDVFVFMSLYGGLPAEQVIKAVQEANNTPKVVDPTTPADSRNNPQEATMPKENTENNAGLKVVQGESADPFELLFDEINLLKQQARDTMSLANNLQQKAKAAQKTVKQQEHDFKSTRDILDKLKKVSGF